MDGMARPSNDGVHLETPLAQTGSSSEGVRSATSGNTPCATSPAEISIPGPNSIDVTKEAYNPSKTMTLNIEKVPNQESSLLVVYSTSEPHS